MHLLKQDSLISESLQIWSAIDKSLSTTVYSHRHTAVTTHGEAAFHLGFLQPPGRTTSPDGVVCFMPPLFLWMRRGALRLCGATPMAAPPCRRRAAPGGFRADRQAWLSRLGRALHSEFLNNTVQVTQREEVQTASWSR